MKVVSLNKNNFETQVLKHSGVYAVRFWAEWCGPCRAMEPMYKAMAEEPSAKASFGEVDIDRSPEIAAAFGIRGVPTVILFKDGKPVEQVVGLREKSKYAALIDQLVAS